MKTTIIINEQHTLLPEQATVLTNNFNIWDTIKVPAEGWDRTTRDKMCAELTGNIVFVSPVPGMILGLAMRAQAAADESGVVNMRPWVFANDTREKKELPDGRVISVLAKTGWYLE